MMKSIDYTLQIRVLTFCVVFLLVQSGWSQLGEFTNTVSWSPTNNNETTGSLSVSGSGIDTSYQINGYGRDIWFERDEGFYAYKNVQGNATMQAHVAWGNYDASFPKVGLMIREDPTDPESRHFFVTFLGGGRDILSTIWRDQEGSNSDGRTNKIPSSWDLWLRVTRINNSFFGEFSLDGGTTWQLAGSHTFSNGFIKPTAAFGIAITSQRTDNAIANATFDSITFSEPEVSINSPLTQELAWSAGAGSTTTTGSGNNLVYNVTGTGAEIFNKSDEGYFLYKNLDGSVTMQAKVNWLDAKGGAFAKIGLMVRENPDDPFSRNFSVVLQGSQSVVSSIWRRQTGIDAEVQHNNISSTAELWLRITHDHIQGSFIGEYSTDGTNWTSSGNFTFNTPFDLSNIGYGIAMSSFKNDGTIVNGTVSNLHFDQNETFFEGTTSWEQVGQNHVPGSVSISGSGDSTQYQINGNGNDIFHQQDEGFYVYKTETGNKTMQAHVTWGNYDASFPKLGLMVRENPTDPNSRHFFITFTGGGRDILATIWRDQPRSSSAGKNNKIPSPRDLWLRVTRIDNTFFGEFSLDGTTWQHAGNHTFENGFRSKNAAWGLAITSQKDDTALANAFVDHISIVDADTSINSPLNNEALWPQIGSNNVPGYVSRTGNGENTVYEIFGNGNDIWNEQDEGYFAYKHLDGSVTMQGRVVWNDPGHQGRDKWPKIGLMVREDPKNPSSRHFIADLTGGGDRYLGTYWRNVKGGNSEGGAAVNIDDSIWEMWLRITYNHLRGHFIAESSSNGNDWSMLAEHTFAEPFDPSTIGYGIAITSFSDDDFLAKATVTNLSFTQNSNIPFDGAVTWPQVGTSNVPGFINISGEGENASYQIGGNGNDIFRQQDEGFFVYKYLEGNVTMEARVVWNDPGHQGTDKWPKIGLMVREEPRDPASRHFYVDLLGGGNRYIGTIWRESPGKDAGGSSIDIADGIWEARLRVTRNIFSNTFTSEYSLDNGVTWNTADSYTFPSGFRAARAAYGLAITSFSDDNFVAQGTVSELSFTVTEPTTITPPDGGTPIIQNGVASILDIVNGNLTGKKYQNLMITGIGNIELLALNGDIEFTANGIQGNYSSSFELFGLPFAINDLNINTSEQSVTVNVTAMLPEVLGGTTQNAIIKFIDNGGGINAQLLGGRFEIPGFKLFKKIETGGAYVELYPLDEIYGGGGSFILPGFGDPSDPRQIGGSFLVESEKLTDLRIEGTNLNIVLGTTGLILDTVGVSGENLNDEIELTLSGDATVTGGPSISIGVEEITAFEGELAISHQPSNGYTSLGGEAKLFGIDTGNASITYNPPNYAKLDANVNVAGIFDAAAGVQFSAGNLSGSLKGNLTIPDNVPIAGGRSLGKVEASIVDNGRKFRGSGSITLSEGVPSQHIPRRCWDGCGSIDLGLLGKYSFCACITVAGKRYCMPQVCVGGYDIPGIPASTINVAFEYNNGQLSFSTKAPPQYPAWETPYNNPMILENGSTIEFMTNWDRIDKVGNHPQLRPFSVSPQQQPITFLTVPNDAPAAIFRITFENPNATDLNVTLTRPDQVELHLSDGLFPIGFDDDSGFSDFDAEYREAYFVMFDPEPGDYIVTFNDVSNLGEYSVELLIENIEPYVDLIGILPADDFGTYFVDWDANDPDTDNLDIKFYLDTDREDLDGVLIPNVEEYFEEIDGEVFSYFVIDTNIGHVQPGWYYVLMTGDDGQNGIQYEYSNNPIFVDNLDHPEPVSEIRVKPIDGGFTVKWEPIDDSITNYTILYTLDDDIGEFEHYKAVGNEVTEFTITDLQNGVPVLVSVVGNNEFNIQSGAKVVQRVIPTIGIGETPSIIGSKPKTEATATYPYVYFPTIFDGDFTYSQSIQVLEEVDMNAPDVIFQENPVTWELLEGPVGMMVDPVIGLVQWVPTVEQVGTHNVALALFDNSLGDNPTPYVQEYKIEVYGPNDASGLDELSLHFVTQPQLTAVRNTTYTYQAVMPVPEDWEIWFELVAGPIDMDFTEDGYIEWDVPNDAIGEFISIDALIVDGENFYIIPQTYFLNVVDVSDLETSVGSEWMLHKD